MTTAKLTKYERVELELMCGNPGTSNWSVAVESNDKYQERPLVDQADVGIKINLFRETRSVNDCPHDSQPKISVDEPSYVMGGSVGRLMTINFNTDFLFTLWYATFALLCTVYL
jgi:hypothetical protein